MLRSVLIACLLFTAAQGQGVLAFEVASIKPNTSEAKGGGAGIRPGRFDATNATLLQLIAQAYGIQAFGSQDLQNRIVGGPKWISAERYNVSARTEQAVSRQTTMLMAQTMLGERFQLKIHRETKEMPVYALVVGKDGPKVTPNTDEGQGDVSQGATQGTYRITARKMPMYVLTSLLENQMDRVVVDRTGLQGNIDFQLEWALDLNNAASVSAPSVFSAVQERLGLKLESTKGPVEVIVIDHVERPSEN
jgi:uncharacterized protein (TIGR03435 family)